MRLPLFAVQAQPPQQAALAASGILPGRPPVSQAGPDSITPAGTVWCPGSSGLQPWPSRAAAAADSDDLSAATESVPPAVATVFAKEQQHKQEAQQSASSGNPSTSAASTPAGAASASARAPSVGLVSEVFAAMRQGPLLPPRRCIAQGTQFAQQLLSEAADVQQQLAVLSDQAWPALVEHSMQEGWQGHSN